MPGARVRTFTDATQYRYAITVETPEVVILGRGRSQQEVESLIWETKSLRPATTVMVLADEHEATDAWSSFGDAIAQVVTLATVCDAFSETTATSTRTEEERDHRMNNRLAGLLAGLHAMAGELHEQRAQPEQARQVGNEYVDRLVEVVRDLRDIEDAIKDRDVEESVLPTPAAQQGAHRL